MRNLKKHLSVLLVLAMVFTMLAPVFAASSYNYEDEAKALYGLGLYKGVSDKNFVPDLGSALTREQSAIILLRLFGQEQEAQALTEGQVNEALARFADAGEVSSWARHQVAYAASTGVIKGIQSENGLVFNPKGALKGIDYASLVLQQLGVKDFDYFGALEKLASLNAITVPQMIAFDKEQLTRDDVVGMSYGVLTAQAENGSTVIENLVEKGLVERAYAEELGLVEKQETPAVEPSTEPSEEPSTEPSEQPVAQAKVEFIPAESRVLSRSQSLFEIGQVQITAADEPVVVTGLKLQRTGISADTVVKSITVWNGNEKVNSIGRFSTGIANIAFTKVVTVPAGQTVKLPIRINVNNTAGIASELKISLLEVKSDTALAGNFPMAGNAFTIADVDLGTLTIEKSGDAPSSSLNAGDKNVRLAKFDFEVSYEPQTIKRIVFSQDGTATDTDLTNLKLIDEDGTVLALGEINKGELAFNLDKECASGTTARLTIRGDVVGGAGRTIKFSIDNVNDVQAIGKTYGTTVVAGKTAVGVELQIEKGSFILAKASSSPAAATVAKTVDDQKFTAVTIDTVGEPIQIETVTVDIDATGEEEVKDNLDNITGYNTAVREIKLVSNGVVLATQEIKKSDSIRNIELPLSEVLTVDPRSPITMDVLLDLKEAKTDAKYSVGVVAITGTGLVSERDITLPATLEDNNGDEYVDEDAGVYGNPMTVGDVKITVEPNAEIDGYAFPNQSKVTLAEFNVSHNLGEAVRLSSITLNVSGEAADNSDIEDKDVQKTFRNFKVVSANGSEVSEPVRVTGTEIKIPLSEGVIVEAGKTLKLGLIADVKSQATAKDSFNFKVSDVSAVTVATGTKVSPDKNVSESRNIIIANAVEPENVTANYSNEKGLKDQNILAGDSKDIEIARWTLSNSGAEAVKINKVYLTPNYTGITAPYIKYVLKAENGSKGTVLLYDTFTMKEEGKEIPILNNGSEGSRLVIDAQDGEEGDAGEIDLVLYARVANGATIGGKVSVALGKATEAGGRFNLYEITGKESGFTETVTGNELIEAGKGKAIENTVSVSRVYVDARTTGEQVKKTTGTGIQNRDLVQFTIKNAGEKTVTLSQIGLEVKGSGVLKENPDYNGQDDVPENIGDITKLELYESSKKVTLFDIDGENLDDGRIKDGKVLFRIAKDGEDEKITLKKGESKTFTIRTSEELKADHNLELSLDRKATLVGKVQFKSGEEVGIDYRDVNDDKDTISLGNVIVEHTSN